MNASQTSNPAPHLGPAARRALPIPRLVPLLAGLLLLGVAGWFYRGLYVTDDVLLAHRPGDRMALLALRVLLPAAMVAALVIATQLRGGRIQVRSVIIAVAGTCLALLLAFPVGSAVYYRRLLTPDLTTYHPYLQINPPLPASAVPAGRAIFFLGGSSTAWPDSRGADWPGRVEQLLNTARPDRPPLRTYNLGREWYTSLHSLINYTANLRHHRPAVVVIMHALNDLLHNADFSHLSGGTFRDDYGHFRGPLGPLLERQELFTSLAERGRLLWYAPPRTTVTTTIFPGLPAFRRHLSTLIELASHDGARVVLMTEPTLLKPGLTPEEMKRLYLLRYETIGRDRQWHVDTAVEGMRQYNEAIRVLARTNPPVTLIDLDEVIPRDLTWFRDEVHYTDRAFPLIAAAVTRGLKEVLEDI